MTRWEYEFRTLIWSSAADVTYPEGRPKRVLYMAHVPGEPESDSEATLKALNSLGGEGWELVSVTVGLAGKFLSAQTFYFKREV